MMDENVKITTTSDSEKLIKVLQEIRDILEEMNRTLAMTNKQKVTKSKLPLIRNI